MRIVALLLLALPLGATSTGDGAGLMRLDPCPSTPNCVSTEATRAEQQMEPIPFTGPLEQARAKLVEILDRPRVEIVESDDVYVHAVFTSRIFRFKDDVEFVFDRQAKVIRFRSASRVGRSDLGANRRRMEQLTREFEEASVE